MYFMQFVCHKHCYNIAIDAIRQNWQEYGNKYYGLIKEWTCLFPIKIARIWPNAKM